MEFCQSEKVGTLERYDWQTGIKTLPCRNFVAGSNKPLLSLHDIFKIVLCRAKLIQVISHMQKMSKLPKTSKTIFNNVLCINELKYKS